MDNTGPRIAQLPQKSREQFELKLTQTACTTVPAKRQIPRRATEGPAPLSFAQQRLWFLDQLESCNSLYNVSSAYRLNGRLHIPVLERSLEEIIRRHDILRTVFKVINEVPLQIVRQHTPTFLPVIDLSDRPEIEREAEAQRLAAQEAQKPFELAHGPLVRCLLLQLSQNDYILLLNMHHIVTDGWSIGILYRELSCLYNAFKRGEPSPLPQLTIQYTDYSVWQREWLQGATLAKQLDYWKGELKGVIPLRLPLDRPRPRTQTFNGARESCLLCKRLTDGLKSFSRKESGTLFMTLMAAFQLLLHRYTAQDVITVGSPIANRNRLELEPLMGFFVNTLVFCSDLSGNPTFRQFFAQTKEKALGAYDHQDLPFEKLVQELHPERDLSNSPLFQVAFAMQNTARIKLKLDGLTVSQFQFQRDSAKFDLTLTVREEDGQLRILLQYNTDLFNGQTIARMLDHFQNLLEGIIADPDAKVRNLPILTPDDWHRLSVVWNDTARDYPKNNCIHQLFEKQVERTPDAVALAFEDQRLTYGELNNRANRLAHYLRNRGVGPEVLVGICMDRSIEMVVGLLGVLKAGGAYVPLDPSYPKERLAFMLEDAQIKVLLTQVQFAQRLPNHAATTICLERDREAIERESQDNPASLIAPDNLAYVIYTSGSTGKPKGVMIQHSNVVNFLASMAREPGLSPMDVLLAVTTLSFDIAGLEIFLPLTVGARVVLASRDMATDGARLSQHISDCKATVIQATPATWRMLLASGWQGSRGLKILCGGEALSEGLAKQLLERCASLWNVYGPTETTIWSSVQKVAPNVDRITLGRPIANTRFYILDQYLQPVPVGVTGELHIAGEGVARGYLNRPDLTSEKFIADPFSEDPGRRLYKTGDLVRYLSDGSVEFLGRADNQVKIRGYRIELGEIETVLNQHPGVREAVVLARENTPEDKRLVAYVVPRQECDPTVTELRSFAKDKLPEYMVPSGLVFLESFPLTPNGKVDRRQLPQVDPLQASRETYIAPRTPMELLLAGVWRELLGVNRVSVHDNFFDLGGHSLLSMKVVAQIEKKTARRLNPRELIFGTLGQLAAICEPDLPKVDQSTPGKLWKILPKTLQKLRLWS